ncbi:hypothetical protein HBB16_13870 [Pseudonocardia sp. MCCB 268]|nr:hypothetical protein [Pseudonocardia cytotoxica]
MQVSSWGSAVPPRITATCSMSRRSARNDVLADRDKQAVRRDERRVGE